VALLPYVIKATEYPAFCCSCRHLVGSYILIGVGRSYFFRYRIPYIAKMVFYKVVILIGSAIVAAVSFLMKEVFQLPVASCYFLVYISL